jgi:hypothetical protein
MEGIMPSNPFVVHPSKIKWTGRVLVVGLFATLGFTGSFTLILAGVFYMSWASSLFLGAILATSVAWTFAIFSFAVILIHDVPRLEVRPEGFVLYLLLTSCSRQWNDIEGDFVVRWTPFGRSVAYRLSENFKTSGDAAKSARPGSRVWVGNCFEKSPFEVAELLNEHKRRAARPS